MARYSTYFSPVGRFFNEVGRTMANAGELDRLCSTPDAVFKARGTTRDEQVRALLKNL